MSSSLQKDKPVVSSPQPKQQPSPYFGSGSPQDFHGERSRRGLMLGPNFVDFHARAIELLDRGEADMVIGSKLIHGGIN